jgi:hypothetical protein
MPNENASDVGMYRGKWRAHEFESGRDWGAAVSEVAPDFHEEE